MISRVSLERNLETADDAIKRRNGLFVNSGDGPLFIGYFKKFYI